jgi:DNA-binding transcriptional MerR regulator
MAKPESEGKIYYSIGEVASLFDVNASLIRFWEKEFGFFKPLRNKKGNRLFTKTDIEKFRTIYHLVKERGYTLQGAKEKMSADASLTITESDMADSLNKIRNFLLELKNSLDAQQDQ